MAQLPGTVELDPIDGIPLHSAPNALVGVELCAVRRQKEQLSPTLETPLALLSRRAAPPSPDHA
jgi:hypothetical protein